LVSKGDDKASFMRTAADLINDPIRPTLVRMTVPMMFGMVSLMLFNLADAWFVGQLGTGPLAALSFTFPISFSITSLAIGLGVGTSATLARLIGSGQRERIARVATDNYLMCVLITALTGLIGQFLLPVLSELLGAPSELYPLIESYMSVWFFASIFMVLNMVCNATFRSTGDTRLTAAIMLGSSLLNAVLDPILIFGWGPIPSLGIQGAAIASLIAWASTSVLALYLLKRVKGLVLLEWLRWPEVVHNWRSVLHIALPAALSNMMTPLANGVLTAVVARHGPEAVAAFGVGNRLESLALLVCLALSMTLPPFISQNFGAKLVHRVQGAYQTAIQFALLWQLLVYLIFALSAGWIAQMFTDDPEVTRWLTLWILIVPLGFGFQAATFLSSSTFNALHQPMRALRVSLVRLFLLYVPLGWLGNHFFDLTGMFVALVCANALTALFAWFWMLRVQQRLARDINA